MTRPAVLELEEQMVVIARRLRRAIAERAAALDPSLSTVAYAVLEYLRRNEPSRQTDIVTALGSEKGAVSRAIRELVDLGFVESVPDASDGRVQRAAITALGTERLDAVIEARRAAYAEKLRGWSSQEIRRLAADLARYNATLDK